MRRRGDDGPQPMRTLLLILVNVVGLVVLAAEAYDAAAATNFKTKNAAYQSARACLMQQGARQVGRRGDGGGFVYFNAPRMDWTYKTTNGVVSGVTYVTPPATGFRALAQRKLFVACVTKGI